MVVAMTVLIGVAMLGLVVYVLCGPRETWDLEGSAGRLGRLKKRRERVLRTMKDLETEREAGRLTDDEFRSLRSDYKRQAIHLSRELERARRNRLRRVSRGVTRIASSAKKRVERLVAERKGALSGVLLVFLGVLGGSIPLETAEAGVVIRARVFDAEASFPAFRQEFSELRKTAGDTGSFEKALETALRDEIKVPFTGRNLSVELVDVSAHAGPDSARVLGTWQVRTGADGSFVLDTQRESVPRSAAFVAMASDDRGQLFTPFFSASDTSQSLMLYRTSGHTEGLLPEVQITYDKTTGPSGDALLRVQVLVQLRYWDYTMYVGRARGSSSREIFRIPLPEGATIVENRGPGDSVPGWVLTADGRGLVINSPVPGIFDTREGAGWQVTYDVPARQRLVQSYALPFGVNQAGFVVWCLNEDMTIESPQLGRAPQGPFKHPHAPVSTNRSFDAYASTQPLATDSEVQVWLNVDNAAIGQVSVNSVKWVGGFVLAFLVAILAGLVFGRGAPPPEVLFGDLSGEEILDRIVDLDRRREAGKIRDADYRKYREALVELAAEEIAGVEPAHVEGGEKVSKALSAVVLPKEVREILRRLDELEEKSSSDPQVITERAHLLEALAKALPREARTR